MQIINYWYGKNVLITGINGFIGGNLAKKLVQKGATVYGIIRNIKSDSIRTAFKASYYDMPVKYVILHISTVFVFGVIKSTYSDSIDTNRSKISGKSFFLM